LPKRAVNCATNKVQRKVKEYEKQARQDRGEDVSDEEEEEEEGEITDDVDGIPWEDLAEEDELGEAAPPRGCRRKGVPICPWGSCP
jgi:hypothetical protein